MAIEGSVSITTFCIVGVWIFSIVIPEVEGICPHHCLKKLPTTDTCLREGGSSTDLMKEGGGEVVEDVSPTPQVDVDAGKMKRTGGLDNHGNCRVVDQGSLTYQFKLTDSGEHCTKCFCEYGHPPGSDPTCKYVAHEECTKLRLTPLLRGPESGSNGNNNPPAEPDFSRPPSSNGGEEQHRPPSSSSQTVPDFDEDFDEFDNTSGGTGGGGARPPLPSNNNGNVQPDLPQQGTGTPDLPQQGTPEFQPQPPPQPPFDDSEPEYQFHPPQYLPVEPEEIELEVQRPLRKTRPPSSHFPSHTEQNYYPEESDWTNGYETEFNIRPPRPPPRRKRPQQNYAPRPQRYRPVSNWATDEFEFNSRPPRKRRPSSNFESEENSELQRPTPPHLLSNWATGHSPPQKRRPSYQDQRPEPSNFDTEFDFEEDDRLPPRRPSKDKKFTDTPPTNFPNAGLEFEFGDETELPQQSQPPPSSSNIVFDYEFSTQNQSNSTGQKSTDDVDVEYGLYGAPPPQLAPPDFNFTDADEEFQTPPDSSLETNLQDSDFVEFQLKPSNSNFSKGPFIESAPF